MGVEKKVLFTASIAKHILRFHIPYLRWFKDNGFTTYVACNGEEAIPYCDRKFAIPFQRSPLSVQNIRAYRLLRRIINEYDFKLIHCHTPVASVVTRLAARAARKKGTRLLYTAHGFHFFKNGPLMNWLTYYPVEAFLSYQTDAILTINKEDFEIIHGLPFYSKTQKYLVHGVGVDDNRFRQVSEAERKSLRQKHGFDIDAFILIYVGEFIARKNHQFLLQAVPYLRKVIPNLKVLFAGRGVLQETMKHFAKKYDVHEDVIFLGFRDDVHEFMQLSNVGISASKQEGLGLNLAEEMLCGLPIVATMDRGHRELVEHGSTGFLFQQKDINGFVDCILKIYKEPLMRSQLGGRALERGKMFSLESALRSISDIYKLYI